MKTSVMGMTLLFAIAPLAFADDKPSIESECRAIAESHGVAADKLDEWMKRCQERTQDMQQKMNEKNKAHGMDGMGHDNMNGMGHGGMGDMHGKPKEEGK